MICLQVEYTITVQMLEVYNESLRDLLVEHGAAPQKLDLLNTQPSGCNVPGANKVGGKQGGLAWPIFWGLSLGWCRCA